MKKEADYLDNHARRRLLNAHRKEAQHQLDLEIAQMQAAEIVELIMAIGEDFPEICIAIAFIALGGGDDSSPSDIALFATSLAVSIFHMFKCIWAWSKLSRATRAAEAGDGLDDVETYNGVLELPALLEQEKDERDEDEFGILTDETLGGRWTEVEALKKDAKKQREAWQVGLDQIRQEAHGNHTELKKLDERVAEENRRAKEAKRHAEDYERRVARRKHFTKVRAQHVLVACRPRHGCAPILHCTVHRACTWLDATDTHACLRALCALPLCRTTSSC